MSDVPSPAAPKRWGRKGCLLRAVGGLTVLLVGCEMFLRVRYGLGDPPLFQTDAQCAYRAAPSHTYHRFGNLFTVNAYSQRSAHDPRSKTPGTVRVMCLGDSITNGGVQTADAQTYPAQLEADLDATGKGRWETLNASAGGWAPANELGYLKEFGTCGADAVVIQVAAHDLYQPKAPDSTAGTMSYPTTRPPLAIVELLHRYLFPRLGIGSDPPDPGVNLDSRTPEELRENQQAIADEVAAVRAGGAKPIIWYIQVPPRSRAGVDMGPDTIALDALTREMTHLKVPILNFTDALDGLGGNALFRDALHPNPAGDREIARLMAERLPSLIGAGR